MTAAKSFTIPVHINDVGAIADYANVQVETNETNNARAGAATVQVQ